MSSRASLNHIFRTVWNQALGAMVAVAETDSSSNGSSGRRIKAAAIQRPPEVGIGLLALSIAIAWSALPSVAIANPTGGVAVVGQATFANNGNKLLVTTQNGAGGNYSAINWQSFSIPAGSSTYFQQPNAASTSINRVVTNTPTQIFGTLSSNGNLVLVNQAGIAVGTGAVVDTNGFTASSLAMSDADAMAGRLRFGDGTINTSGVSVNGSILARSGDVVLLGANVNTGADALVQAPNGSTILAAGQQVEITGRGLEGIRLQVQAPTDSAVNLGTLKADAVGMFAGTLKHSGLIQATAATLEGGKVVLKAADLTEVAGTVQAQGLGNVGGAIHVTGNKVLLKGSALLDASGENGGGEVLVGGGWHGEDARLSNAQFTLVGSGAQLKTDATGNGNGGQVVVWSDGATRFAGTVSAQGGALGGNGGNAEVSGKQYLDFQGKADLRAPLGRSGNLLLDPLNLTISSGPADINGDASPGDDLAALSLLAGTSPGANSVITAGAVVTQLASGNVLLEATNNINVNSAIAHVGGPTSLTLNGGNQINLNAPISTSSGALDVSMTAGAGGIVSSSGGISTSGGVVHLISSGNMSLEAINVGAGNISLNASSGSSVTQSAGFTASGIELKGGGSFTLTNTGNVITKIGVSSGGASDGAISFTAQGGLAVDTVASVGITRTGSVTLNSFGGAITQTQPIVATSLSAIAYGGVTLNNASNSVSSFSGSNGMTGGISYKNAGALSLGAITAGSNNLQITTGGAMTQSAALTVGGTTTLDAGGSAITLTNGSNSLTGAVSISNASNASISTAGGVSLAASTVSGALTVVAGGGAITQSGPITASTLDMTVGSGAFISLSDSGNLVSTLKVNKTAGTEQVTYYNNGALSLGPITTGGALYVSTANGTNISQSGAATVGGLANLSAGSSSGYGSLILTNGGNNFSSVNLKGSQVSIYDSNALTISNVYADTGGALIQSAGSMTISGSIKSTASGDAVKLISGGTFNGGGGFIHVNTASDRWLAYLATSGSDTIPITYQGCCTSTNEASFKQYGASYGSAVLGTGNGVLYATTPSVSASLGGSASKIYDGTTSMPVDSLSVGSFAGPDNMASAVGSISSADSSDANVGTGKLVTVSGTISGVVTGSGDLIGLGKPVYGYQFTTSGNVGAISPAAVTVNLSGSRVYDGTNIVNANIFSLSGLKAGETLSLTGAGTVADKNVGVDKPVTLGTLALGNATTGTGLASNYTLVGGTHRATITVRPVATWIGGASGAWNDPANWDALPVGNNVLAVSVPSSAVVTFDNSIGTLKLDSLTAGGLVISGGNLTVNSPVSLVNYTQSGGTLGIAGGLSISSGYVQTGGALTVSGPVNAALFSQSGGSLTGSGTSTLTVTSGFQQQPLGTIVMGGAVTATQATGALLVGSVTAPTVTLTAATGNIVQDGPLVVNGLLSTQSATGAVLTDAGNKVSGFTANNTGSGNIALTNVGVLTIPGITNNIGDITINNIGGFTTVGAVRTTSGSITGVANSPLTIGAGGVSASGNITLTATNLTSSGNLTLNGPVNSGGGSVALAAASNYVQNSTVSAARGVTATAGGEMTFGPDAITSGNPVNYTANGAPVIAPGTASPGSAPIDFVATFMDKFEQTLVAQNSPTSDPADPTKKDKEQVVVEGQSCTR